MRVILTSGGVSGGFARATDYMVESFGDEDDMDESDGLAECGEDIRDSTQRKNKITALEQDDATWCTDQTELMELAVDFYKDLLSSMAHSVVNYGA
ncbi:hypothetical protein V6N12_074896 [Hibiscus sabdariffa]|uniref:Uncharacterized protein n=1 Tax=Hibiscus sabdariffa TaxID=183260 RepID=A0ABR2D2R2_9ROSI